MRSLILVLSFVFSVSALSLNAHASATCLATKQDTALKSFKMTLVNGGKNVVVSNFVLGSKVDPSEKWPAQDVGTLFAPGKYGQFSNIYNVAYWRMQLYLRNNSVVVHMASTDGLFFYDTFKCYALGAL